MKLTAREAQETSALLMVLAMTNKEVESGKVRPAPEAFERIRSSIQTDLRDTP